MRRRVVVLTVAALAAGAVAIPVAASAASPAGPDPAVVGQMGPLFEEPTGKNCRQARDPSPQCKPAAMSLVNLPNGKVLYWDGLEGMNKVNFNVVAEYGNAAQNDQSRVMSGVDSDDPTWTVPKPYDGGANPNGNDKNAEYLPLVPHNNDVRSNDGDLFCSSLEFLPDGKIMVTGGTDYYQEPGIPGIPTYGAVELEGLKNTRVFDPKTNSWGQSGGMNYGRWYPSMVTQPDGTLTVFSGVTKLIKPVYADRPLDSGTNVKQTENYDPKTGAWTANPATANKSLPLYPRLHLLPDGKTYYDAGGQTFNPFGQSYDEALWSFASVYDPKTQKWTDKGLPSVAGLPQGFRGSGFSAMLPLRPGPDGTYPKAQFLSAGGVLGVSPGTYLATNSTTLNTIDTAHGDALDSKTIGNLNEPRWYGTGTVLPTGQVFLSGGANRDEVVLPGTGNPVRQTEMWDPKTQTWTPLVPQTDGRTYHNTATLLPSGEVLIGGHAPIATGYAYQTDLGTKLLGLSRASADPTFQIYKPPYLFWGPRPEITGVDPQQKTNSLMKIGVANPGDVSSVVVSRNTADTHLIDSDQRTVGLPVVGRDGSSVTVKLPDSDVTPAGPYMLFVNRQSDKGEIPSVAKQLFIDQSATTLGTPAPGQDGPRPARDTQGDPGNGTYRGPGAADNGYTKTAPAAGGAQHAPAPQQAPAPLNGPAMDTASGPAATPALGAVLTLGGFGLVGSESGPVARLRRRRRARRGTHRDGSA